jgi:hypothetical protein
MLWSVHADGYACLVEGEKIQGWEINAWVTCNRLLFHEPMPVIKFDVEGE